MEEGRDDEEAGAVEQGTSKPEAVGTLGEKSMVVIDREAGFPDSHQVRPLQPFQAGFKRDRKQSWSTQIVQFT